MALEADINKKKQDVDAKKGVKDEIAIETTATKPVEDESRDVTESTADPVAIELNHDVGPPSENADAHPVMEKQDYNEEVADTKTHETQTPSIVNDKIPETISNNDTQQSQQQPKTEDKTEVAQADSLNQKETVPPTIATEPATVTSPVNEMVKETSSTSSQPQSITESIRLEENDLTRLKAVCNKISTGNEDSTSKCQPTDSILQLIVSEDLSAIKSPEVLRAFFIDHLKDLPPNIISEVLSVLVAIVKKSVFHLESAQGLLIACINYLLSDYLVDSNDSNSPKNQQQQTQTSNVSLTKHFLREWVHLLISHSCDVQELKSILKFSRHDPSLLNFLQQANVKQRCRPHAFFAFPGTKGSMMSLPPFQKWPTQNGWSFNTWFFLEPKAIAQPYLFNFKTGKSGLGYSAHFTGNCLVLTSIRVKGKGVQHCVAYEFPSYKWIHCAITYHNKWRASEIKVYVNGQLAANIEMPWQVQTNEVFDKCFIGGSGSLTSADRSGELNCFCGQMSALYLFNEGLSPAQICALHRLGPSYMGQFKYSNESHVNLPPQTSRALYDERLASTLFCLFTPVAVDSGTLSIQLAPFRSSTSASAQNYFISAPHAALQGHTKAIITQPICSTLQSIGCTKSLLPLLDAFASKGDAEACSSLVGFLCDLLESSPHWFANEIVQNNGFVMVACALSTNSRSLLSEKLLDIFLSLARTLLTSSSTQGDSLLLKHLMDNLLFNPALWIYADTKLQIKLYSYLATEFLHGSRHASSKYTGSNSGSSPFVTYTGTAAAASTAGLGGQVQNDDLSRPDYYETQSTLVADLLFGEIRRVSTVLQSLHALKYYYWISDEKGINQKGRNSNLRPSQDDLTIIRSHILSFARELILKANGIPLDETQGILNYLSTCMQPENILDVLDTLAELIRKHPALMIPAIDQKHGIKVLFNLIGSKSEPIRLRTIRLLSLFLSHCTHKRKQDMMTPNNLFMLLCDRLRAYKPLNMKTYQALVDLLIDADGDQVQEDPTARDLSKVRIENPMVIKVIASLLHEERSHPIFRKELQQSAEDIRKIFIRDFWNLIVNSRENRRIVLQMSVWQHWLINLIDSTIDDSQLVRDQVLAIFRVLLYHAIRYEYGGWRVWIDTLAIIHTKVSYDEFCKQMYPDSGCSPIRTAESPGQHRTSASKPVPSKLNSSNEHAEKQGDIVEKVDGKDECDNDGEEVDNESETQKPFVSSISQSIPTESRGIQMEDEEKAEVGDGDKEQIVEKATVEMDKVDLNASEASKNDPKEDTDAVRDSPDLAPSRAYRKMSLTNDNQVEPAGDLTQNSIIANEGHEGLTRQQSLTSISLDDPIPEREVSAPEDNSKREDESGHESCETPKGEDEVETNRHNVSNPSELSNKATTSPAFRIPEFKWGAILIKLLNDLMFSIECDLYRWKFLAQMLDPEAQPFVPKTASTVTGQSGVNSTATSKNANQQTNRLDAVLQKVENQIYIINIVHLVSQLADNIIIASGGLLPLLADATGGAKSSASIGQGDNKTCEGLTLAQANSLLYRLVHMIDIVIFASPHINLNELESDKNTTSGGILRQCLRLVCTVTVKNCLILRSLADRLAASENSSGQFNLSDGDFPKDMFDSYQGCSLQSVNQLFENSALDLEGSDLIADVLTYTPHQIPNTASRPSILPFQTSPIKDANKLLQTIDINRIQECIYHDSSTESRQSQFLALSSLYFISVLMVSKYRDIIEPKKSQKGRSSAQSSPRGDVDDKNQGNSGGPVSSIEANLLNFGKMQPTGNSNGPQMASASAGNALTNMLTSRLETTLDTVCPLLKSIMCDFCSFLSKTLVGSHGQDLVNKEAERTFRRANTSPVELVMLLCSQEWQNTLQKNAGLAFIELINEGRVLSHGMKDHIIRVAMEAEFILSRLRADDVAKHEQFGLICSETLSARLHEEALINSLISSAARRDYLLYCKFKEIMQTRKHRNYKLDIWEDDDRRKRRFVHDSWTDEHQSYYPAIAESQENENSDTATANSGEKSLETKRILELQRTIEMSGIHEHCSPGQSVDSGGQAERGIEGDECDDEEYEDEEDIQHDSNSPDSEADTSRRSSTRRSKPKTHYSDTGVESAIEKQQNSIKSGHMYPGGSNSTTNRGQIKTEPVENMENKSSHQLAWEYEDCGSISDYTGSVLFATECSLVWSIYAIPGVFQLTGHELYFEPNQNVSDAIESMKRSQNHDDIGSSRNHSTQAQDSGDSPPSLRKIDLDALKYCDFLACNGKILLNDIRAIFSRHYLLQPHALEIFLAQRSSIMFAFPDFDSVKRAVKYLPPVGVGIKYGIPQTRRASLMSPRQLFASSNMTQKWQKREIGNFQYLMFLNTIAGRTYQDLNQYPVFPWILTNYESEELDLNLPTNFRDLSKPIGALNNKRRAEFIDRYQSWDNPKVPAFHYGTHYSTAAFTLNWLCRLRGSYNSAYLALQDGKYEESTRLFLSIGDSWVSSLVGGQQNVKELIPEFYYLPEMFHSNLNLPEVEFPPWAKSAEEFVRMHRIALESELVSCQLHQWIDLIFGYKQRGPEAVNAVNTFYYLTYQGNVNLNMIQDPALREAIETQIKHFGQTPSQLTTEPHPPRFSALHASHMVFSPAVDDINKVIKFPFNTPVVHISSCISDYIASANSMLDSVTTGTVQNSNSSNSPSSVLTITSNNQYQIHKWVSTDNAAHPFTMDPQLEQAGAARRQLIDVDDLCSGISLKLQSASGDQTKIDEVHWPCAHYVVTLNGHYIIMGSFYDNSFRVFTTESGKLCQVIYGHRAPITCIARSEGNATADFYIATGSQDCSLLLWTWNERFAQVEGSGVSAVHNPLPKLSITGHQTPVLSAMICAELGLIVSGSKNLILVHTTTLGESVIEIDVTMSRLLNRISCDNKIGSSESIIQRPQVQNKQKTILEASMLGDQDARSQQVGDKKELLDTSSTSNHQPGDSSPSPSVQMNSRKFSHLREFCTGDYYITNLQFARELAFIVCAALPAPRRRSRRGTEYSSHSANSVALLCTFNLKGNLMECTTIGQSITSPRLGDVCMLQTTRDGEHLILNDSPTSIKIYRTFDLQPIYAYNTNDVPNALSEDQNRVRSLALLDHRYILVGLDNGKIIVYNADFKNLR